MSKIRQIVSSDWSTIHPENPVGCVICPSAYQLFTGPAFFLLNQPPEGKGERRKRLLVSFLSIYQTAALPQGMMGTIRASAEECSSERFYQALEVPANWNASQQA